MKGLDEGVTSVMGELSYLEEERESAIALSRRVIRQTKAVIHDMHASGDASSTLPGLRETMDGLLDLCQDPWIRTLGPVQDAMCEYCEAVLFVSMMHGEGLPTHTALGVTAASWAMGLADCEGEIRRAVMTRLMDGDLDSAMGLFRMMEEVHNAVMLFDVPDGVAPMRRKQDIARGIMDKTRSDLTMASIMDVSRR